MLPPVKPYMQYRMSLQWLESTTNEAQHLPWALHLLNAFVLPINGACGIAFGTWITIPAAALPASGAGGVICSLYPLSAAFVLSVLCLVSGD